MITYPRPKAQLWIEYCNRRGNRFADIGQYALSNQFSIKGCRPWYNPNAQIEDVGMGEQLRVAEIQYREETKLREAQELITRQEKEAKKAARKSDWHGAQRMIQEAREALGISECAEVHLKYYSADEKTQVRANTCIECWHCGNMTCGRHKVRGLVYVGSEYMGAKILCRKCETIGREGAPPGFYYSSPYSNCVWLPPKENASRG